MAYNTKTIIRDVQNVPIPQYFNQTADTYEAIQGTNGAMIVANYDSAGNEVLTAANPGKVTVQTALPAGDNIVGRVKITDGTDVLDVASDGSLTVDVKDRSARILGKITADDGAITTAGAKADAAVTDPTASASMIALLKGLIKQLQGTGTGITPILNQNSAGTEIFTASNPGVVNISTIPEVEIKNDSGNPLPADVTDRASRALGVVTSADGGLSTLGAKADAAVTNPASAASAVALLKGLLSQLQGTASAKTQIIDETATLTSAPLTQSVTVTSTPIAITSKANLKQLIVKNRDYAIRARLGETGMTPANDKGFALEPNAVATFDFDPNVATTIYAYSEGAAVQLEIVQI